MDEIRTDYLPLLLKSTKHQEVGGIYDRLGELLRGRWNNKRSCIQAKELIEETYLLDVERVKHNAEVHAHNTAIRDAIIQQMLDLGFSREVYMNRNPRTGRETKKRYAQPAPWLDGIELAFRSKWPDIRYLVVSQERLTRIYDEERRKVEKELERYTKVELETNRDRQLVQKQRQELIKLTKLCIKYGVEDINPDTLLDELYKRDRHLELAFAMMDARGDFQRGYDVAFYLSRFEPQNDTDNAIVNSVQSAINRFNSDPDGRYFRDCSWSYTDIFELVEKELYSDASEVHAMLNGTWQPSKSGD